MNKCIFQTVLLRVHPHTCVYVRMGECKFQLLSAHVLSCCVAWQLIAFVIAYQKKNLEKKSLFVLKMMILTQLHVANAILYLFIHTKLKDVHTHTCKYK